MKQTAIVILIMLYLVGCAENAVIITGTPKSALGKEAVKTYSEKPNENCKPVAEIFARASGWNFKSSYENALTDMLEQAAKLGANGVILKTSLTQGVFMELTGTAITCE